MSGGVLCLLSCSSSMGYRDTLELPLLESQVSLVPCFVVTDLMEPEPGTGPICFSKSVPPSHEALK